MYKWHSQLTVIVESIQMNGMGSVSEVDEGAAVRPALYYNATWLCVKRKQSAVKVTRSVNHSTKPPSHSPSVMHVRTKHAQQFGCVEVGRAVRKEHANFSNQDTGGISSSSSSSSSSRGIFGVA